MWGKVMMTLVCLLLSQISECTGVSPPGKPVHLNCRSPEKETFTCWWKPGSDGGLSTTHQLYYQREDSDRTFECPDYQSAGRNACFFDRSHTSIWLNYNITVVASNTLGTTRSDPLEVDVMYIVQPNAPENVTASVKETEGSQHLLIKWEPPHDADTRSGWITLTYQLRVRRQTEKEWEEYFSGKQTQYVIYSPHPGEVYMVQVRCEPDHGSWSEWSSTIYTEVPDYSQKERSVWIAAAIFLVFVLLIMMFTLCVKRKYLKHCLLPPVPGPKITGFDGQLFKNGQSEDILGALINQGLPPMVACRDHTVAYLVAFDTDQDSTLDFQKLQTTTKNYLDKCPSGIHLPTAINNYREKSVNSQSNCDGELGVDHSTLNMFSPSTGIDYVDVLKHKVNEQVLDNWQGDYSKVGGMDSDNILLLQKGIVSLSSRSTSCKGKGTQAECTRKPCKPDMSESIQEGMHTGPAGIGYVETILKTPTL